MDEGLKFLCMYAQNFQILCFHSEMLFSVYKIKSSTKCSGIYKHLDGMKNHPTHLQAVSLVTLTFIFLYLKITTSIHISMKNYQRTLYELEPILFHLIPLQLCNWRLLLLTVRDNYPFTKFSVFFLSLLFLFLFYFYC